MRGLNEQRGVFSSPSIPSWMGLILVYRMYFRGPLVFQDSTGLSGFQLQDLQDVWFSGLTEYQDCVKLSDLRNCNYVC